ncbi:helix-turn-helix domain-containing protein [Niallia sp. NCCP-28]|uniref:helix-turn-helix domain-containing protein n=1 Tax=Niallia sp. NCCP-28 TaxID=2934712 RepID=UPI002088427C|nr:helix-turn-helix domain-containing protein [Niallia sp. NCCP-28]GKU83115.1 hypothetical protein NCCP28_25110 [Niallia sp. NCCP-28]
MNTEKQLISLIHAAQVLTSTLDLDKVLDQLIHETLNVIEGADAVLLFVYNPKKNKLLANKGIGVNLDYLQDIMLSPNEGMTGKTFTSKKGQIFSHLKETEAGMGNIQNKNQDLFKKAIGKFPYHPISTICAPLLSKKDCIGVLTIDSFSENVHFTERDLLLLETFAAQASIAIENAKFFADTERSKKIHAELATASISQKGLTEATITLSQLIRHEICVYNEFFDLLAFSSSIAENLGEQKKKEVEELFSKGQKELESNLMQIIPIKTDGDIVLGIVAIFGEESVHLDTLDLLAIDLANNIFAREILGRERLLSEFYKYEGYLLEQLLAKKQHELTEQQRTILGLSKKYRYFCISIQIPHQLLPFEELHKRKQHFNKLLFRELKNLGFKIIVSEKNLEYNILVIIHDKGTEDKITKTFYDFFYHFKEIVGKVISFDYYVGIGRVFQDIPDITNSHREAKICAEYIQNKKQETSVLSYKSLGIYRLFLKHEQEELFEFVESTIGALLLYDKEHRTELLQTLTTYLESKQNMALTARNSFVHLNTIKYRLQTIKEILGANSLEGKVIFELQLAIYLHQYLQKGI